MLAQHYAIGLTGSLSARLLVTNWALKQKETLKGQTRPDSLCWLVSHPSQPDSSPPQTGFQALQGLAGDRQHSGLLLKLRSTWPPAPLIGVSLTRTLQGLQSSTGHQSCQGQTSIMSRRAWRNKSSTTHKSPDRDTFKDISSTLVLLQKKDGTMGNKEVTVGV